MESKSEVQVENAPAPVRLPAMNAGGAVRAIIPQDLDSVWRLANAVVKAGLAPKSLETPEKVMIAIMHGLEVGFTPMAAIQSIAVINGRTTIYGDGAIGLAQGSGKMESIKEWFEGDADNRKAICHIRRKGDPELKIGEFSIADAKRAKLWGKQGPWTEYPNRMLQMRARAFPLRDGFADVLRGLGIAEEVQDIQPVRSEGSSPEVPRRASEVAAVSEAAADPETEKKESSEPEAQKSEEPKFESELKIEDMASEPIQKTFTDSIARVKFHDGGNIGIQTNKNDWVNTRDMDMGNKANGLAATGKQATFTLQAHEGGWKLLSLVEVAVNG